MLPKEIKELCEQSYHQGGYDTLISAKRGFIGAFQNNKEYVDFDTMIELFDNFIELKSEDNLMEKNNGKPKEIHS